MVNHKNYKLKFTDKAPACIGCICVSVSSSSFSLHESGNSPRFSPHCPHPANLAFRPGIGKGGRGSLTRNTSCTFQPSTNMNTCNLFSFALSGNSSIITSIRSVVDPCHFGTDPDPRNRTIKLRIRILLLLSVAFKMSSFLLFGEGTFTSVFKYKKVIKKSQNSGYFATIQAF
jgi:hypothetical protein